MADELNKYIPSKDACQKVADNLLTKTGASRITYRIATSVTGLCPVFVESLDPAESGLVSLLTQPEIDLSKAATFNLIATENKILLHCDCLDSPVPSPETLITVYGAKSQMLLPTFVDGKIWSVVSVHEAKGTRKWNEEKAEDGTSMTQSIIKAGKEFAEALGVNGTVPNESDVILA